MKNGFDIFKKAEKVWNWKKEKSSVCITMTGAGIKKNISLSKKLHGVSEMLRKDDTATPIQSIIIIITQNIT